MKHVNKSYRALRRHTSTPSKKKFGLAISNLATAFGNAFSYQLQQFEQSTIVSSLRLSSGMKRTKDLHINERKVGNGQIRAEHMLFYPVIAQASPYIAQLRPSAVVSKKTM